MTLRSAGLFTNVLCDGEGCSEVLPTTEREPVLAFYEATLRNGWKGSVELREKYWFPRHGVFCPGCVASIEATA